MLSESDGLTRNYPTPYEHLNHLKRQPVIVEYNTVKDEMADITNKVEKLIEIPGH